MGFVQDLASLIAKQEGWGSDPSRSVATRLNNPGNLEYARQSGATPVTVTTSNGVKHTFASWPTPEQGFTGLENQIKLDMGRGLTLAQLINKWAPASEKGNNTTAYLASVAAGLGVSNVNTKLSDLNANPTFPAFGSSPETYAGVVPDAGQSWSWSNLWSLPELSGEVAGDAAALADFASLPFDSSSPFEAWLLLFAAVVAVVAILWLLFRFLF